MDCIGSAIATPSAGDDGPAFFGLSALDGKLFVPCYFSDEVKVFDQRTLEPKTQWKIERMKCPGDIKTAPWEGTDRLFVLDWTDKDKSKRMYIVNGDGESKGDWPSMEDDFGRLSLTKEMNFVEIFHDQNAIAIYSIQGQLERKILIQDGQGIKGLQHAIKLSDNRFVLCHGDPKNELHRVCIVDSNGKLLKSFGGKKGSGVDQLDVPVYLALLSNGDILVADKYNGRIRLLSPELELKKDLVTPGLRYPVKILLDEPNRKLYVVDNDSIGRKMKDGRVMVFKIYITAFEHLIMKLLQCVGCI